MYHMLNQKTNNNSHGISTPDSLCFDSYAQSPLGSSAVVKQEQQQQQGSLWDDKAIAAVTYEVLQSSPELFHTTVESDPVVEYSNWLASVHNSPVENELPGGDVNSSVFSALSLIDDAGLSMQQLDKVRSTNDLANLLDNTGNNDSSLLSSLQQGVKIDLAATELLFASMVSPESKKRARSLSSCSSRSSKRYSPYHLPGSLTL